MFTVEGELKLKKLVNTAVILTLATSLIVLLLEKSRGLIKEGFRKQRDPVISPAKYASLRLLRMSGR